MILPAISQKLYLYFSVTEENSELRVFIEVKLGLITIITETDYQK